MCGFFVCPNCNFMPAWCGLLDLPPSPFVFFDTWPSAPPPTYLCCCLSPVTPLQTKSILREEIHRLEDINQLLQDKLVRG